MHRIAISVAVAMLAVFVANIYQPQPKPEVPHIVQSPRVIPPTPVKAEPQPRLKNVTQEDLECLAQNIYHEARGESVQGMVAVANVTVNRALHPHFPNTVCGVVRQGDHYVNWKGNTQPVRHRCQFSWYCDGRSDTIRNMRSWKVAMSIASAVLTGRQADNTGGATHYYNPHKADPVWKSDFQVVRNVGNHVFLAYAN